MIQPNQSNPFRQGRNAIGTRQRVIPLQTLERAIHARCQYAALSTGLRRKSLHDDGRATREHIHLLASKQRIRNDTLDPFPQSSIHRNGLGLVTASGERLEPKTGLGLGLRRHRRLQPPSQFSQHGGPVSGTRQPTFIRFPGIERQGLPFVARETLTSTRVGKNLTNRTPAREPHTQDGQRLLGLDLAGQARNFLSLRIEQHRRRVAPDLKSRPQLLRAWQIPINVHRKERLREEGELLLIE